MIDVSSLDPTGYSSQFTFTSGSYTITGTFSTDADKAIRVLSGDVTKTVNSVPTKIGTLSVFFSTTDDTTQDDMMTAIKACREALRDYLDTPPE